jgi:hypothetical protein
MIVLAAVTLRIHTLVIPAAATDDEGVSAMRVAYINAVLRVSHSLPPLVALLSLLVDLGQNHNMLNIRIPLCGSGCAAPLWLLSVC